MRFPFCLSFKLIGSPLHNFAELAEWGRGGLIVFFVLSGFLIAGILLDLKSAIETKSGQLKAAIVNFYARRAFGIFPVYYLSLVFILYFALNDAVPLDCIWHVFFLNNISNVIFREHTGIYGPAFPWCSLAVEEQFYLLWAPVALLRHMHRRVHRTQK